MVRPRAKIRKLLAAWACTLPFALPVHAADRTERASESRKSAVKLPKPEYSRVRAFNIPFESGEQGNDATDDFEPELWESLDLGDTWDRVQTVPTKEEKFLYRATRDGEHWFAIRERNLKTSKLRPPGDPTVELRVIVDTRPPELELTARQDPGGQVVANWKMRDDNLDPRAFELEYQTTGDSKRWIRIKTEPATPEANGWHSGETVQFVPDHPTAVVLRAVVVDRAGNETVKSTAATLERVAARSRDDVAELALPSPGARSTWSKADARERASTEPRDESRVRRPRASQFPSENASDADDPRREGDDPPSMPNRFSDSKRLDRRSPNARPLDDDRETLPEPDRDAEFKSPRNHPANATKKKEPALKPAPPKNRADRRTETKRRPESPPSATQATYPQTDFPADEIEEIPIGKPESAAPSRERRHDSDRPEELAGPAKRERDPARAPRKVLLPGGVEPRRVNFTRFRLDYQVDQVGSSGVKEVELWCTRDGGKSWDSFGLDDDNQSPMMVQVDDEGTYGFTLVVRNGSGLKGHVPRPGDMAEFWVVVDLSQPEARLISAEPGAGAQSGALVIRWEAEDNQLADRPIVLSYSDSPDGPWSPIAAGLDNSGSYPWGIDEDVPDDVYIRLQVRDAAGNVGTSISEIPVPTTQARPEAPILDVRPAPENGQSRRVYNLR